MNFLLLKMWNVHFILSRKLANFGNLCIFPTQKSTKNYSILRKYEINISHFTQSPYLEFHTLPEIKEWRKVWNHSFTKWQQSQRLCFSLIFWSIVSRIIHFLQIVLLVLMTIGWVSLNKKIMMHFIDSWYSIISPRYLQSCQSFIRWRLWDQHWQFREHFDQVWAKQEVIGPWVAFKFESACMLWALCFLVSSTIMTTFNHFSLK